MANHQEREGSTTSQSTHAGVFVLSTRGLWDRITDFMTGYPFAVLRFYQEHDPKMWLNRHARGIYSDAIGIFTWHGVLPNLVIAANDPEMLQLLHMLSEKPYHRDDYKFTFRKAMCCAVLYNNVEMLELLKQLKADDLSWTQEANLLRLAIERDDPDVRVIDWLFQHLPPLERVVSAAALHGHFELVRYFVESGISFRVALVIDSAAAAGHLEILRYLIHNVADCRTDCAMFCAGEKGHLDVLKFLHEHRAEKCSPRTLTRAAANGHLEVVKFLHETYGLNIFSYDLSAAAENGHLEVVKFVHQHCPEVCSLGAMDGAAAGGHLEVVEFLHFNRTEGCAAQALKDAAGKGHLGVIKFLCEHRTEGNVMSVLFGAICDRNLKVVKALHGYRKAGQSLYGMVKSIAVGSKWPKREIVAFLCKNQECEPTSFLLQAVVKRSSCVAELVIPHATLDELVAAKEYALKLNDLQMVEIIAHGILRKTNLPIGE